MWHDGKVSYLYCGNQFIIHKYEINILSVVTQGHNSKNQGGSFNVGTKTRPLWPFPYLPHVVTINGLISGPPKLYNLSPLLPQREKLFALILPPPSICASSNQ